MVWHSQLAEWVEKITSAEELNARLAYVNFDGSEALKISKLLSASSTLTMKDLGKNIDNIKAGIEKLIDWLKE